MASGTTPPPPSRKPQSANFNYTDFLKKHQVDVLTGLGIVGGDEQKRIMKHLKDVVVQYHPNWKPDTKKFEGPRLTGNPRTALLQRMYQETPEFSEAPDDYLEFALEKLLHNVCGYRLQPRSTTKRGRKVEESDEEDAPEPPKRPRRGSPAYDDRERYTGAGAFPRRSTSLIHPEKAYSALDTSPNLEYCKLVLSAVKDGKVLRTVSKVHAALLQTPKKNSIDWTLLVEEVMAVEGEDGFSFQKKIYLSPRPDQLLPIRTQATLTSALREMRAGDLIVTTLPVDPDVRMTDLGLEPPALDDEETILFGQRQSPLKSEPPAAESAFDTGIAGPESTINVATTEPTVNTEMAETESTVDAATAGTESTVDTAIAGTKSDTVNTSVADTKSTVNAAIPGTESNSFTNTATAPSTPQKQQREITRLAVISSAERLNLMRPSESPKDSRYDLPSFSPNSSSLFHGQLAAGPRTQLANSRPSSAHHMLFSSSQRPPQPTTHRFDPLASPSPYSTPSLSKMRPSSEFIPDLRTQLADRDYDQTTPTNRTPVPSFPRPAQSTTSYVHTPNRQRRPGRLGFDSDDDEEEDWTTTSYTGTPSRRLRRRPGHLDSDGSDDDEEDRNTTQQRCPKEDASDVDSEDVELEAAAGEEEERVMADEEDAEARNELAAEEATRYALAHPATMTAYARALKEDLDLWIGAAKTLLVDIADMQHPEKYKQNCIVLKLAVGLRSGFGLYAHQIVGIKEMWKNVYGPRRAMIQGDEMGFGKTVMIMMQWAINYRAVAQLHNAKVVKKHERYGPTVPSWPVLEDGKVDGCSPREGAMFISASPNGIEVWVKTFMQMMGDDAVAQLFEEAWRPKLIICHADGPRLSSTWGGEAKGIYPSTSKAVDWHELLPQPDWSKARIAHGQPQYPAAYATDKIIKTNYVPHPRATPTKPSPTSARVIVLTTNQSFKSNVGCIVYDDELGTEAKKLITALDKIPPRQTHAALRTRNQIAAMRDKKASCRGKWGTDGTQPLQATRVRVYRTSNGPNPKTQNITEVVDLRYASCVVVDELHSAAGADTISYRQIIKPFIDGCGPNNSPGILGATGTALQNGAGLVMNFLKEACLQAGDTRSEDPGVRAVLNLKDVDIAAIWKAMVDAYQNYKGKERKKKLESISEVDQFHAAFRSALEFYFIARDSQSKDPWGKSLTILNVGLEVRYTDVEHSSDMWARVLDAQNNVKALRMKLHEEHLAEWREQGAIADLKPQLPTLAQANPNAYLVARIVSCFPNVLQAIEGWQRKNPREQAVIADFTSPCLGNTNPVVRDALQSSDSIKNSFIWAIAEEACRGSRKVELVVDSIELLRKRKSKGSITYKDPKDSKKEVTEEVLYRSKYVVAVGMRFARALLWAYLCKQFGKDHVVSVANKTDCTNNLPLWRRFWNKDEHQVDDKAYILVAGLKVISQSITLTEGHILCGFDPPSNNNDEKQFPKRQHRPGQKHDCAVDWLVTVNPDAKDKKNKSMRSIETAIVQRNQAKSDFFTDMRGMQATKAQEAIDLTKDDLEDELDKEV